MENVVKDVMLENSHGDDWGGGGGNENVLCKGWQAAGRVQKTIDDFHCQKTIAN